MGRWCGAVLWVILALGVQGCVSTPSTPALMMPPAPLRSIVQTGRASWYGGAHHGQMTASGERFDMNALTAAHPTLPFGTRLRVMNLDNDRQVDVRVNDRGPAVPGRIIDLSYAAARALGAVGAGLIWVRLTVLGGPEVDARRVPIQP
jgi:peptidoglycan lytic transglycosylase